MLNQKEQEFLKKFAALMNGEGMKKEASASNVSEEQMNADFAKYLKQGEFGFKKAAMAFDEPLRMKIAYAAITPKILDSHDIANSVAWADVEFPEFGAVVLPFRGAAPHIEKGTRRIMFKTHTIALNWDVFYDDVFTAAFKVLDEAKDKIGIALALAIDAELMATLGAAVKSGAHAAIETTAMTKDVLNIARGEMMKYDLIAQAVVMHPTRYYEMLNQISATTADQVTLNTVIETGYLEQLYGVKFYMTKQCPTTSAYVITDKVHLGRQVYRQAQQIKITDIPMELKYVVTGFVNQGITIHNPAGVIEVKFTA